MSSPLKANDVAIIFPTTKNAQRLACLALICRLASVSRATSTVDLSRRYHATLAARKSIANENWRELESYLRKRNLLRKYPGGARNGVEIQDWLLGDPQLPSNTGAEKEETSSTVDLAAQLGLLWPATNQTTWLGALLADASPAIDERFRAGSRQDNPYLLSNDLKLLLGCVCLHADGTFLGFISRLISGKGHAIGIPELQSDFSRLFPEFLAQVQEASTAAESRETVAKLRDVGSRLARLGVGRKAAYGGVTTQTVRRLFEETFYWRLEALTDLGYLRKPDGSLYEYVACAPLADFQDASEAGLSRFLNTGIFAHLRGILGAGSYSAVTGPSALGLLREANQLTKNQLGYTGIDEGLLVANMLLLKRGEKSVLERENAYDCIRSGDPAFKILVSVDKNRQPSAYKILERPNA